MFINLCDGAWDEDRAGLGVVQALERFNLPFTGASSNFYEPSKELMKMAAYYAGVNTPAFQFAYNDEDIEIVSFWSSVRIGNSLEAVGCSPSDFSFNRKALQWRWKYWHDQRLKVFEC